MKLTEVTKNDRAIIVKVNNYNEVLYERLSFFGVHEGEKIQVIDFSYFKNNIKLKVKNSLIALRFEEADMIEVKVC